MRRHLADAMVQAGAFLVPTLVTYQQLLQGGQAAGMAAELVAKVGKLVQQVGWPPCWPAHCAFAASRVR